MYDIKIFVESDWTFAARLKAGKEVVYWVWNNQEELLNNLKDWIEMVFAEKKLTRNTSRLVSFLDSNKKDLLCR
jgi:hypothetical protein